MGLPCLKNGVDSGNYTHAVSVLNWLGLLLVALAQCPGTAGSTADGATAEQRAELAYANGTLRCVRDGVELFSIAAADAAPYRIVALGPPALLTTCGADLQLAVWAVGGEAHRYPGMLPVACQPPLVGLAWLESAETEPLSGCTLLNAQGEGVWSGKDCELLVPVAEAGGDTAYVIQAHGGDLISPFGQSPALTAFESASGRERWSTKLKTDWTVAGVDLWALGPKLGLLSLQYGYEEFDFVLFRLDTGRELARHAFKGQIAYRLVYPGPDAEPASLVLDAGVARLLVQPSGGALEDWSFDLRSGALSKTAATAPGLGLRREENLLPVGGRGAPDPSAPPFPQTWLPVAGGSAWRIPAYMDAGGRVLVIEGGAAKWVEPGAAPGAAE